jgi:hypothetical protein
MFDKYNKKIKRRIYSLLSREIDTNVKLGITDAKKITENFTKEIQKKELDTWKSLREYVDSRYFYNECIKYVESRLDEYLKRYGGFSVKGKVSPEQADYLVMLIERALKHKNYNVRMNGLEELKELITMLSKNSASYFIDQYKGILGWNKSTDKTEKNTKEGETPEGKEKDTLNTEGNSVK